MVQQSLVDGIGSTLHAQKPPTAPYKCINLAQADAVFFQQSTDRSFTVGKLLSNGGKSLQYFCVVRNIGAE